MINTFPRWKYALLIFLVLLGLIYALPNIYGEDPAVQITQIKSEDQDQKLQDPQQNKNHNNNNINKSEVSESKAEQNVQKEGSKENHIENHITNTIRNVLKENNLPYKSIEQENAQQFLVRFLDTATQIKAKDLIYNALGENYSVALNLAPLTPTWLEYLGAHPMKLGLDLRGGVHFLLDVDIDSVISRRLESYYSELPKLLREEKLRYSKVEKLPEHRLKLNFESEADSEKAKNVLEKKQPELAYSYEDGEQNNLIASLSPVILKEIRHDTMEQTMNTLRNRVNELGVAEAIVQRHGLNQVVVELPGIQDTAYAKNILGKTATLKFMMVDHDHDIQTVLEGRPVPGSKLYKMEAGYPILLKNQIILTGDSVTGATTSQDRDGRPAVTIRLGGDISLFSKTTRDNIGKRMATVYVEAKDHKIKETVINAATIQSALGNNFQVTGLKNEEARDLALLLRSGALPATISIVEERIVGPSMGQENIRMGQVSVAVGLGLVLIFMAIYYGIFGIIADIALVFNLILLLALMSLIGATLTLPGIAGIVLTLGMAVDANVLIFERIREELRLGLSPKAAIYRGYEYAFATIVDSNLTTLIVGIILFAVGTGPVKGFAVTLCIGILTSMITATTGSRAIVYLFYERRPIKHVPVGV